MELNAYMEGRKYWVGFNHVKGIGSVRLNGLIDYFGELSIAWQASFDELRRAGLPEKAANSLIKFRNEADLDRVYEAILQKGIRICLIEDPDYPKKLKEVDQPPPVLYIKGEITVQDEWCVAIVGTRKMSALGKRTAEDLSAFLGRNGITVVSGLARGIDTAAHRAVIEAGGRSIAVLGCGVDTIYPPENRGLAEKLILNGALVSDYAPGTPPDGINFPPRNRIISGLSLATVVVEADEKSGALITATFAVEQGRDVFAVPGSIYAAEYRGTNRLIQQGARPLLDPREVLDVLQLQQVQEYRSLAQAMQVNEDEGKLLGILHSEPIHIDEISALSDLPIQKVSATLALMELKGMVQQIGGMNYIKIREPNPKYRVNIDE